MSNISQYQLDEALEYFQYALDIAPDNTEQDLLQIAKIHSHMGGVFNDQKEYPEALSIREKYLPPVHPLLATIYNNIGSGHQSLDDHQKTYSYLQRALKIELKALPPNHPTLAVTYHNISKALENLCRYQDAFDNQKHAVDRKQMILKDNEKNKTLKTIIN
jgi:tetratricopeptide (TPR) repeat protein